MIALKMTDTDALTKHDFEVLADFRYQIRRFERFSEEVTRSHEVTPLQYLLLLHIKGYPARNWGQELLSSKGSFKVPDVRAFDHEAGWSAPGRSRRQPTGNKHFVTGDKG